MLSRRNQAYMSISGNQHYSKIYINLSARFYRSSEKFTGIIILSLYQKIPNLSALLSRKELRQPAVSLFTGVKLAIFRCILNFKFKSD